jgi:serine/threonine protein kinase
MDDNGHVRIMDFGLTIVVESDVSIGCGSTRWMASELLSPDVQGLDGMRKSTESDVYALGCTLWEVRIVWIS